MNEELKGKKVSAISLGCDKNRVDLEKMLFLLSEDGFEIVPDCQDADIVIVNTCAFITPAKQEALKEIFDVCLLKEQKKIEKVIVSGCLAQRYANELAKQIPEVDVFLKADENQKICQIVRKLYGAEVGKTKNKLGRIFTSHGSYAYLKIAEGCSNACSYCTIPRIKGRYVSFDMDDIVEEAKLLAKKQIRELVLVAQDVSRYGEDLYGENKLIELCKKLCKIDGIEWIRLHYLYPEKITDELLKYMQKEPKMCKYLDIPLQHVDDAILKSMRRKTNEERLRCLIDKIHISFPEFKIRTTFIVGYPGETRKQFKKLCEFLKQSRFDYAGFFPFYREENTPAYFMDKQVGQHTKNHRLKVVKKIQNKIASQNALASLGKTFKVLVDDFDATTGFFVGHTQFLSPTVDFGVKIVDNGNVESSKFVTVRFTDFDGSNFKGELI